MSKVLIFMAEGHEEIEALTVVDILRRADIEIDMVSITGNKKVPGSHGITTYCDKLIENTDFEKADMIVLPGGMPGTLNLGLCEPLMDQIHGFNTSKKGLAAICAAPTVFGKAGLLEGKKATCYPGMEGDLLGANVSTDSVCHDGHIITSRGMGTAIPFALEIVKTFKGEDVANKLAQAIVYNN
ncbi:4-methyl-5(b-hydroxyethyl)-thiazole monophosphate biosynthesis [Pseudobutyrivibrio ruminis]|uniref:4-methyl-5(B-hydroxyethyl)-thiazole monophosphate biosynthesis n=1 Tax=Pseudobutyrivibrio ruminis TaxID=46206 RepID=A0A1H7JEK3_9FIRM|nr:DJ-1 family glyoxalase III [Pseudobutyrivibrio ruminis]SEK72844.1 4-methyl-5(b-hydroxyethyl)-thiazole monophosphate biosynthesis [Pseudobutyrivibrio ruminis]